MPANYVEISKKLHELKDICGAAKRIDTSKITSKDHFYLTYLSGIQSRIEEIISSLKVEGFPDVD